MSAWSNKPNCANPECGRKKSPGARDRKFCTTCQREKKKVQSKAAHGKRVEATYGITEEDYWALYEFQGGRCALCQWAQGKKRRLAVDHDHRLCTSHPQDVGCSACVRGLLCTFCNRLIGFVRDSVEYFQRGVDYLRDPPWRQLQLGLYSGTKELT